MWGRLYSAAALFQEPPPFHQTASLPPPPPKKKKVVKESVRSLRVLVWFRFWFVALGFFAKTLSKCQRHLQLCFYCCSGSACGKDLKDAARAAALDRLADNTPQPLKLPRFRVLWGKRPRTRREFSHTAAKFPSPET